MTDTKTVRERRAQFIRAARAYADRDQAEVAERLGVSPNTIKRIERGTRDVSMQEIKTMAVFFDVPLGFLLDGFAGVLPEGRDLEAAVISMRDELCHRLDRIGAALVTNANVQAQTLTEMAAAFAPITVTDEAQDEGNGDVHAAA